MIFLFCYGFHFNLMLNIVYWMCIMELNSRAGLVGLHQHRTDAAFSTLIYFNIRPISHRGQVYQTLITMHKDIDVIILSPKFMWWSSFLIYLFTIFLFHVMFIVGIFKWNKQIKMALIFMTWKLLQGNSLSKLEVQQNFRWEQDGNDLGLCIYRGDIQAWVAIS